MPQGEVFRVASLKSDQLALCGIQNGGVFLATRAHIFVNAFHLREWIVVQSGSVEDRFPTMQQHPKLGAPVTDVIIANDVVSDERRNARE